MAQSLQAENVLIKDQNQNVLDSGNYKGIQLDFPQPGPAQVKITIDNNSLTTQKQRFQITFPSQDDVWIHGGNFGESPDKFQQLYKGNANTITIEDASGSNSVEVIYHTETVDGLNWKQLDLANNPTQVVISITSPNLDVTDIDEHGIAWFVAKGKTTTIKQSRDTDDDDRWSENVEGCEQGFEATMIAKSIDVKDDGHFAMKQGGSNHSKGDWKEERWLDTGLRANGKVQLEYERVHPKNVDFTLPDKCLFIKDIGVELDGNWIGLKWAQQILKEGGSPADGGVRWRMWINTDIASDGKPDNSKWRLVYDFIDGQDVKVIDPQTYRSKGVMDAEVRRSGTKKHEVYAGGLLVRPLK